MGWGAVGWAANNVHVHLHRVGWGVNNVFVRLQTQALETDQVDGGGVGFGEGGVLIMFMYTNIDHWHVF